MRLTQKHFLGAFELAMVAGMLWFAYSCWQAFGYKRQLHSGFPQPMTEAEWLPAKFVSQHMQKFEQDMSSFKTGQWSQGRQLFFPHGNIGDQIEFEIPAPTTKGLQLRANFTTARDYGRFDIFVNGKYASHVDLYDRFISNREVPILTIDDTSQPLKVVFKISGHHPEAVPPYHHFGIDGFWYSSPDSAIVSF